MRLLLVHGDAELASDIIYSFADDGTKCAHADTAAKGLRRLKEEAYDVILLGGSLPDATALDFLRKMGELDSFPVIVLAEDHSVKQTVLCLEYGADDVLRVPFDMIELKARIRAVLRRRGRPGKKAEAGSDFLYSSGGFTLDLITGKARFTEIALDLTSTEFSLLLYFASNEGRVLTREEIAGRIWGYEPGSLRTVDVHIRRLREKLEAVGAEDSVKTVWREGYRYEAIGTESRDLRSGE